MEIAAIIPAYNEERTIAQVVNVVKKHHLIDTTIVVSDGSTDETANVAREQEVKVIELEDNIGKGGAMKVGVDSTKAELILFLDADLVGLTEKHINSLLRPLIEEDVDMTIGLFAKGRVATDLAQKIAPFLSGQRGVKRKILQDISNLDMTRFGVEVALTQYVKENEVQIKEVVLEDLTHVMKEEKLGFLKGFKARMKMYWEVLKNIPNRKKNKID
ncbi:MULTISPECIES: glycosyltransferase family 2 protein [unclassified Candidatus Frackibacter]|uniref:glycosyltransferase family 2 protein n=1 Tax=unclassified Candidatus Frackibacter TaxID=2648818 RepID=UPI000799B9B1|nr:MULTISPECIES: glycosyltransferase family 2 protein [unclassified Candidatus Frackibacter]KXS40866.1 MAG: family 2 glycosyl transferase [Candidatus Frackibacter sp. T328-2]SDB98608.1 Glycosyl transferase family 2 [Candidatus Frackibacter sp. WG11]SEM30398.1 Glycosyl transferase family 2 [Candidatus Frackibacter sp. WG12]SFL35348.1 Glycosyl transferase family 2 [Candidatus Frackibacter sp. WG13]